MAAKKRAPRKATRREVLAWNPVRAGQWTWQPSGRWGRQLAVGLDTMARQRVVILDIGSSLFGVDIDGQPLPGHFISPTFAKKAAQTEWRRRNR